MGGLDVTVVRFEEIETTTVRGGRVVVYVVVVGWRGVESTKNEWRSDWAGLRFLAPVRASVHHPLY